MQENNLNISQNINWETKSEETIGQIVRRVRLEKRIEIVDAASETKIKAAYLQAIEKDDFQVLPAPIYAKNFIRIYANYLGLDGVAVSKKFNSGNIGIVGLPPKKKPESTYYVSLFFSSLLKHPFILMGIVVVLAVLFFYPAGSDNSELDIDSSLPDTDISTLQPVALDNYLPVYDLNEPLPKS